MIVLQQVSSTLQCNPSELTDTLDFCCAISFKIDNGVLAFLLLLLTFLSTNHEMRPIEVDSCIQLTLQQFDKNNVKLYLLGDFDLPSTH